MSRESKKVEQGIVRDARDDCLKCGAERPSGHVVVIDEKGVRLSGRVCSDHTLKELILDSRERFMVEVILTENGINAAERVKRRMAG